MRYRGSVIQQAGMFSTTLVPNFPSVPNGSQILPSPDAHGSAPWTVTNLTVTGAQIDVTGGTTAESLVETSGTGYHYVDSGQFGTSPGRVVAVVEYKVIPGTNANRYFYLELYGDATGAGAGVVAGQAGSKSDYTYGSPAWTINESRVDLTTNGYYRVWLDVTTDTPTLWAFIGISSNLSTQYAGDGASGFYIDNSRVIDV